jgi:hypothetical protein
MIVFLHVYQFFCFIQVAYGNRAIIIKLWYNSFCFELVNHKGDSFMQYLDASITLIHAKITITLSNSSLDQRVLLS